MTSGGTRNRRDSTPAQNPISTAADALAAIGSNPTNTSAP